MQKRTWQLLEKSVAIEYGARTVSLGHTEHKFYPVDDFGSTCMHGCTIPVTYVACMPRQGSTLRYLLPLELGLVLQVNCETIDEYMSTGTP